MKILITSTLSNNVTIHEFNGKKISDLREYLKILNLYAGIGGNRKLWEGHEVTAVENDDETLLDIVHSKYMSIPKNDLIVMLTNAFEYLNPTTATSIVSDDQVSKLGEVINNLEDRVFEIEYSLQLLTDVNKLRFLNRLKKDYPHLVK